MQRVEAAEWLRMRADSTQREFEIFFCDNRDAAMRIAFAITGDHESASDAVQEGFVKLLDRWKRVRTMDSPTGFLKTTVARCAVDILRSRRRNADERESFKAETDPERIAVRQALAKLKPDQQAVLALSVGEGWSYAEIAEALKIPVGTVASRIHGAKEAFRRQWGDER
jgi:RNA polymerase sigma factor (sigma-70 family)